MRAVLHKRVGQADALDALPVQGPVVDEEFQHGGREASGKGVFLGEQDAVKAACHIEKLLFRKGLDPAGVEHGYAAARLGEKPFGGVLCRDHHAPYRNNHGIRAFAEQFALAEGEGRQGNQRFGVGQGMAGSGAAGITDGQRLAEAQGRDQRGLQFGLVAGGRVS